MTKPCMLRGPRWDAAHARPTGSRFLICAARLASPVSCYRQEALSSRHRMALPPPQRVPFLRIAGYRAGAMSMLLATPETPSWLLRMGCHERRLAMVGMLGYHKSRTKRRERSISREVPDGTLWVVGQPLECGTRPFRRCQGKILLSMPNADRTSHVPSAVVPRGRSVEISRASS